MVAGVGAGWVDAGGYRYQPVTVEAGGVGVGFSRVDSAGAGIFFSNRVEAATLRTNAYLMNGCGVALGDVDGDGWCDVFLVGLESGCRLYRNLGGWRFEDVTARAGVGCDGQRSRGAVLADVDGDGDLDLLVSSTGGGVRLFLNDGRGRFVEGTEAAGLVSTAGSTSLALADIDGDGALDLYVANFGAFPVLNGGKGVSFRMVNGKPQVTGRYAKRVRAVGGALLEFGEADVLYRNDGRGRFTALPWEGGRFLDEDGQSMEAPLDFGLSVQMRDLNGDGAPDIYVCNDFHTPDRMWLNDGRGGFRAVPSLAVRKMSYASMGVDFADLDRDGHLDFLVVEMLGRKLSRRIEEFSGRLPSVPTPGRWGTRVEVGRNTLFWGRGDGTWAEGAWFSGLEGTDWSWQPVFLDVDLDGFEDVLVTNGHVRDMNNLDLREKRDRSAGTGGVETDAPAFVTGCVAYRNRGQRQFEDVTVRWGLGLPVVSHGIALADLDHDGDLDLVVNCLGGSPLLYRNEATQPRVLVRLLGRGLNTQGIGSKIVVRAAGLPEQMQEVISGGRYLSGDDPVRTFAAGTSGAPVVVEVFWRSGRRSKISALPPNVVCEIQEPLESAGPPLLEGGSTQPGGTLLSEVVGGVGHVQSGGSFDDLSLQPTLPWRLTSTGSAVAWVDVDGDGQQDLVMGASAGGKVTVWRNLGNGRFDPMSLPWLGEAVPEDVTALLGLEVEAGRRVLLVGLGNHRSKPGALAELQSWEWSPSSSANAVRSVLLRSEASIGCLASSDIDGDGHLEVFAGALSVPGRYPEAGSGHLFRRNLNGGGWSLDAVSEGLFRRVGVMRSAIFTDLDGDGHPELVIACEWGGVRVFGFRLGRGEDWTQAWGLGGLTGLWRSVISADLDGDGLPDLVVGNWGRNGLIRSFPGHPLRMLAVEAVEGSKVDSLLMGGWDPLESRVVCLDPLSQIESFFPGLRERYSSHRALSQAPWEEVVRPWLPRGQVVEAAELDSMVLLNRGGTFERRPLPAAAQMTPVSGIAAVDLDGDGRLDLVLAQNEFGTRLEGDRMDAGLGLVLLGDGQGGMKPVDSVKAGLRVDGDQRAVSLFDTGPGGVPGVLMAQDGGQTRVWVGSQKAAGRVVRLSGPAGNPRGLGTVVRGRTREGGVIFRELCAGGGYRSQDGASLRFPGEVTEVEVLWPGGLKGGARVPVGAREVTVESPVPGKLAP